MKLHSFIVMLGTGIILASFLTALAYAKKAKPHYYRYIFVFIVLGILLSLNTIASNNYTWRYGLKIRILLEQVLIFLKFLILSLYFLETLKKSFFYNRIKWLFYISIPVLFSLVIIVHLANIEIRPSILPNLIFFIFCIFYLRDLMNNKPTVIIVKSSSFWLTMGIFFSSSIGFPVSSLIPFVSKNYEYADLRFQISSIQNMSLIIMYLFIIKSYQCLKHPQNL